MRAASSLVLGVMLIGSGCAAEKMATDKHLMEIPINATAAVRASDEALWMGDFTLTKMTEAPHVSRRTADSVTELRTYTFTLIDREGTTWTASCNASKKTKSGATKGRVELSCAIESDGADGRAEHADLALMGVNGGGSHRSGELRGGRTTFDIYSKHEVVDGDRSRKTEEPVGFEIITGGQVVGAVQTKGASILWLDKSLSKERASGLVGASAAALLFFDRLELN